MKPEEIIEYGDLSELTKKVIIEALDGKNLSNPNDNANEVFNELGIE